MNQVAGRVPAGVTDHLRNLAPIGRSLVAAYGAAIVFAGIGSRVAMRLTAIMAGPEHLGEITDAEATVGVISQDGTLFLVFFGAMIGGLAGGLVYAAVRPWLPLRRAGATFGLFALAVGGSHLIEARNSDFARFGSATANIAMYAALFVLGGIATHAFYNRLGRLSGSRLAGLLGLAVLLLVPVLTGVAPPTDPSSIGVPGPEGFLIGIIAAALVTQFVAARRAAVRLDDVQAWMGPRLRMAGQLTGGVAMATGLWLLAREIVGILTTVV